MERNGLGIPSRVRSGGDSSRYPASNKTTALQRASVRQNSPTVAPPQDQRKAPNRSRSSRPASSASLPLSRLSSARTLVILHSIDQICGSITRRFEAWFRSAYDLPGGKYGCKGFPVLHSQHDISMTGQFFGFVGVLSPVAVAVGVDQHRITDLIGGQWKSRKRVRHKLGHRTRAVPVGRISQSECFFNVGTREDSGSGLGWIPKRYHERTVRADVVPIGSRRIGQQSRNGP